MRKPGAAIDELQRGLYFIKDEECRLYFLDFNECG